MKKNENIQRIKNEIALFPDEPGIYKFLDEGNTILYVGKAKRIKRRVMSYFNKEHDSSRLKMLLIKVYKIEYILVKNEEEALLLENSLIKKYQPKYNVLLKDDKTYPWITIKNELFPRVIYTRKLIKDGSEYYGPFVSLKMVKVLIDIIQKLYKIRTCKYNFEIKKIANGNYKECLQYHIGNCSAPCISLINEEKYNSVLPNIKSILKGKFFKITENLKKDIERYSNKLQFELAHEANENLKILQDFKGINNVIGDVKFNVDVFSVIDDVNTAYVNYLKIVEGAVFQSYTLEIKKRLNESKEILLEYGIGQIYTIFNKFSREILVPFEVNIEINNVNFIIPKIGDKKKLIEISEKNAKFYRLEKIKQMQSIDPERHSNLILETIKKDLNLDFSPKWIECFDNSNLQGTNPVAACVVFRNAKPSKKDYRKFNIKTVVGPDDFASMREIVYRRYSRLKEENNGFPSLIIVDGGKGQLSSAYQIIKELGLEEEIKIIGIAKRLEEIFFPNDSYPLYLDKNSETLKLIQRMRDEAHRFGITFHRDKRSKNFIKTELNNIDGIGEKTIQKLLKEYKSVNKIKKISLNDLAQTIGNSKAKVVYSHFNKSN